MTIPIAQDNPQFSNRFVPYLQPGPMLLQTFWWKNQVFSSQSDPHAGQAPPLPPNTGEAPPPSSNNPKIKHKQQRLLLFRHTSKCQAEDGCCLVTPYCASVKRLWRHIENCRTQLCPVQHCMSSRYVLIHYQRCSDAKCPVCAPVRELIRKVNGGGGWGGVLNKGDSGGMFGDSTSQGGELIPSSFPLAASEARGTSIADRDGDARNMFPSPDQDSHCPHAKRPKMEHSNGKNLAKEKVEAEVRNLVNVCSG